MTNHLFSQIRMRMPAPDKVFAFTADGGLQTYGDVLATSAQYANALVALGVQPGDRVAVQVDKSLDALMVYLATIRAGAIFLPLNNAYMPAEIEYFLGDAKPRIFICSPQQAASLSTVAQGAGALLETLGSHGDGSLAEKARAAKTTFDDIARGPDDLGAILYTSGTTGRSKGAMLSHENLGSNARVLVDTWRFTGTDVLLHALPIFHTHGLFVATNVVLFSGASMIFLPKFDADEVFRQLPKATTMMGVPTFYVRMLDDARLTREATAHMRLFISGSAPLLAETHRDFETRTGQAILERYGMTETNMNTSNPYEGDRRAGTVGFPLAATDIRITHPENGAILGADEIGMIEVRGPNVFKGYWQNPEKTKAEFRDDGFFITGDLGKIDPRGYVHIVGRGKDLIITGGYNVYPKEIEGEIDGMPGVNESAVIGVPHKDFGEGVTAVVVPNKGASLDPQAIVKSLETRLAKFKVPKRVIIVNELPRNTMGKVQKNILRETYHDIYAR